MKLYTKPGACSLADHIALQWTGQPFDVQVVTQEYIKSPEYLAKNPAGQVPLLEDGDFLLTQNAAILGYIADSYPQALLAGDGSPRQHAEAMRWLAFCNADIHPQFGALFIVLPDWMIRPKLCYRMRPRPNCASSMLSLTRNWRARNGWPASAALPILTCLSLPSGLRSRASSWMTCQTCRPLSSGCGQMPVSSRR